METFEEIKQPHSYLLGYSLLNKDGCPDGISLLSKDILAEIYPFLMEEYKKYVKINPKIADIYKKDINILKIYEINHIFNYQVKKAIIALRKLYKYDGDITKIPPLEAGIFDERTHFLGITSDFLEKLENSKNDDLSDFCDALYSCDARFKMIDIKDKNVAEIEADKILESELRKLGITDISSLFTIKSKSGSRVKFFNETKLNSWMEKIIISPTELNYDGFYCPIGIVKLHEFEHIMQADPTKEFDPLKKDLSELGPTLEIIVRSDEIYKKIKNISLDEEVDYPEKLIFRDKSINLGKIANEFRRLKETKKLKTYEELLLSEEAEKLIHDFLHEDTIERFEGKQEKEKKQGYSNSRYF